MKTLDYEKIPSHCCRCHEYGHIFREFPMNEPKVKSRKEGNRVDQGFTKVSSRKGGSRKPENQEVHKKIATSNTFEVLENQEEEILEKMRANNLVSKLGDGIPNQNLVKESDLSDAIGDECMG